MAGSRLIILKQLAKGLAAQFGNDCEIVIHDLTRKQVDSSIVYIENGHVTNRKIGGSPSGVVLDTIKHHAKDVKDQYAYLTKTDSGHILKSTTIFIKDEHGEPCYVFAINYDITNLLAFENTIHSLTDCSKDNPTSTKHPKRITQDVNDLLDELIDQSVELVGVPAPLMTKDDKIKAIDYLNEAGAFLITKSGDKVSKYFGISKYTLYSYVDINKQGDDKTK
ncbi:MAG: helix-turn-helix transcriptional regulator [Lachnospiraceae bacterium]|nr:helix-turn-helix transcriptional regulator [Lachnospiraceae bacterium]